jgi:hypothetical protein
MQRVKDCKITLARHAKHMLDALGLQSIDNQLAASARGLIRHDVVLFF